MAEMEPIERELARLVESFQTGGLKIQSYTIPAKINPSAGRNFKPYALTRIKLDGDAEVTVPTRKGAVLAEMSEIHEQNVADATQRRFQAINCLAVTTQEKS